ncbi:AraC family ligand binding domain-containing protein [Chitinophaga sp. SYP-B3965]|uniref:AraC family ligand binding domain-containing protein n=1 Tax=Chitinophaga sp. SYP-B3965 TaxID=2663120 RepID=UPI0015668E89|nr:AraC family ligand binding domain-containing protein [Chitinophaga sp. SYP-B3965]
MDTTYLPPSHNLPVSYTEQIRIAEPAHFSVFRRDEHPGNNEPDRSDLYKILLPTKGRANFHYGDQQYRVTPDSILFIKPKEIKSWKNITEEQDGYYCLFTASFFAFNATQLKALQDSPLFSKDAAPVLPLTAGQATMFQDLFIKLYQEFNNILQYNTEMLRLYLHIILIEAGRVAAH